jgi:hypothetical protein
VPADLVHPPAALKPAQAGRRPTVSLTDWAYEIIVVDNEVRRMGYTPGPGTEAQLEDALAILAERVLRRYQTRVQTELWASRDASGSAQDRASILYAKIFEHATRLSGTRMIPRFMPNILGKRVIGHNRDHVRPTQREEMLDEYSMATGAESGAKRKPLRTHDGKPDDRLRDVYAELTRYHPNLAKLEEARRLYTTLEDIAHFSGFSDRHGFTRAARVPPLSWTWTRAA